MTPLLEDKVIRGIQAMVDGTKLINKSFGKPVDPFCFVAKKLEFQVIAYVTWISASRQTSVAEK